MNTSQDATVMLRVLLLALLGILWSELARANAQSDAPAQTQYVWTGVRDGVQRVKPGELAGYAAQLERDLAKLQVAREVDGPSVDLRNALRELWVRAALANEYPRRWDMLAKVAVARAAEFERRGELALARRAADELLLSGAVRDEIAAEKLVFELKAAPDELVRAASAAATPELVALRNRLDAQLRGAPAGGRGSTQVVRSLEEAVDRALAEEQPSLVVDLGARAAPALEALVLEGLDALPSKAALDPLVLLFRVDEARGAAFALENWNRGRLLWRKRVLRAMGEAAVLTNPGTWLLDVPGNQAETRTPPTLVDTGWRELLGRAVKDEDVGLDSFEEIAKLATYDALDAPLQQGLIAKIESGGPAAWRAASKLFEAGRGRESLRPVLERVVSRTEPELQTLAAQELTYFPRSSALLREFGSPTAAVRAAVARSLNGSLARLAYVRGIEGRVAPQWTQGQADVMRPPLEAGDRAVVDALLVDNDPEVRQMALDGAMSSEPIALSAEQLLAVARDPAPKVRFRLAQWGPRAPMPVAVLETLLADTERDVLRRAVGYLNELLRRAPDGRNLTSDEMRDAKTPRQWSDDYLPALVALLANPDTYSFGSPADIVLHACRTKVGLQAVIDAGVRHGAEVATRIAGTFSYPRQEASEVAWSTIAPSEVAAFVRLCREDPSYTPVRRITSSLPLEHRNALVSVLLDGSAPADLRARCAAVSAAAADAQWRAALVELFAGPEGLAVLGKFDGHTPLPDAEREALIQQLLALRGVSDESVAHFVSDLTGGGQALPSSQVLAVLQRTAATGVAHWRWQNIAPHALNRLQLTESEPRTELLEALYGVTNLGDNILFVVGSAHLDTHLPFLERVLLGNPPGGGTDTAENRKAAANALASYLDERAAAILLKGLAATTNKEVRDACFEALESIRRYEDERERWATRKTSRAAREAAIAELVPMLADKEATIRAQAARSLGALEAVEHLPALVRLLKDSNGDVRKAAQTAIDALTAPKPATPAPSEPKRD
jgi:hypothetical protein